VVAVVLALPINPYAAATALAVDAISHYWADRRTTLLALADWLGRTVLPGKGEFARLGDGSAAPTGTGAYALDQSWHVGWLFAARLRAALGAACLLRPPRPARAGRAVPDRRARTRVLIAAVFPALAAAALAAGAP